MIYFNTEVNRRLVNFISTIKFGWLFPNQWFGLHLRWLFSNYDSTSVDTSCWCWVSSVLTSDHISMFSDNFDIVSITETSDDAAHCSVCWRPETWQHSDMTSVPGVISGQVEQFQLDKSKNKFQLFIFYPGDFKPCSEELLTQFSSSQSTFLSLDCQVKNLVHSQWSCH